MIRVGKLAWLKIDGVKNIDALKNNLTIMPKDSGYGKEAPKPVLLYLIKGDYIGIPRQYFLSRAGSSNIEFTHTDGLPMNSDVVFNGTLMEDQQKALDIVSRRLSDNMILGGIINMPVGTGKTVTSLAIAQHLKLKTIVIVHKEFLVRQWKERVRQFLPKARIGHIQAKVCDYKNKDIVIGMVHSIGSKDYPKEMFNEFGLVISDEVHRMAAPTWSQAIPRFNAKWRIGLSATPTRKDNTENVFKYHIGDIIYTAYTERLKPKIRKVQSSYKFIKTGSFNPNKMPLSRIITALTKSKVRNELIVRQMIGAINAGRCVLVLSHRLKHLEELNILYKKRVAKTDNINVITDFYVGGRSEKQLKIAENATMLFGTYQMAKEGLDIPKLDTLVMATPMSDVIQSIGRILRVEENKKEPIVVDVIDSFVRPCKMMSNTRYKTYLSKGWV